MGDGRRMASLTKIAEYWSRHPMAATLPNLRSHAIGWGEPFCFACGWLAPVPDGPAAWAAPGLGGWLERAHLQDHWIGGSGEPENLVPLCCLCHDAMPAFDDRASALAWVANGYSPVPHGWMWQVWTDARAPRDETGRSRLARMLRMRGDYLGMLLEIESATSLAG